MINIDHFKNARWGELYSFFAAGDPPLVLQLLALNTLFLAFFIVQKVRAKIKIRNSTIFFVQAVLILSNCAVMFQKEAYDAAMALKNVI